MTTIAEKTESGAKAEHTPTIYTCKRCGWHGEVAGRQRCLKCAARRTAQWRKDKPDLRRQGSRRRNKMARQRNPEVFARRKRQWRAKNPEVHRQKYAERLAWLARGDVTQQQLSEIYAESDGKCHYCNRPVKARFYPLDPRGFDHVIPRSKGGMHTKSNLVLCCGTCNENKSDRDASDFVLACPEASRA